MQHNSDPALFSCPLRTFQPQVLLFIEFFVFSKILRTAKNKEVGKQQTVLGFFSRISM